MPYPMWSQSWLFELDEWVMFYACRLDDRSEFAVRDLVRGLPF